MSESLPAAPRPVVPRAKQKPAQEIAAKVSKDAFGGMTCFSVRLTPISRPLYSFGSKLYQAKPRLPGVDLSGGELLFSVFEDPAGLADALEEAAAKLRELK